MAAKVTPNITVDTSKKPPIENFLESAKQLLESHRPEAQESGYGLSPAQLNCLVDPKNPYVLQAIGGLPGLENALHTSSKVGLGQTEGETLKESSSSSPHADPSLLGPSESRIIYYGANVLPARKAKSLFKLMWMALQDKVLIMLSVVAVISLALGLYETFGQPPEYDEQGRAEPKVDWVEGVAIVVAILIVVLVGAGNDYQKERQFVKLNKKKEDRSVKVLRGSSPSEISIFDILVGDLLLIEPGDMLPCDAVLVRGFDVKCDESSATGESATMKKITVDEVIARLEKDPNKYSPSSNKVDAFLISGSKVLEGTGVCMVIAVGTKSIHGRTMLSLQVEPEETPLQVKLNNIAEGIAKLGSLAGLILFVALLIRFFTQLPGSTETPAEKGQDFLTILLTAITIIVVAVPEGLPLAVTLALAFATTRMVKDNNLVRVLRSCETMGGATTVCSDKTGTLTQNRMTVVTGVFGSGAEFKLSIDHHSDVNYDDGKVLEEEKEEKAHNKSPDEIMTALPPNSKQLLLDSIAVNSSAFEVHSDIPSSEVDVAKKPKKGRSALTAAAKEAAAETFIGSKTETALLNFAKNFLDMNSLNEYRSSHEIAQIYPFDSAKKFMATVIARPNSQGYRLLVKGASEVILSLCTSIYDESSEEEHSISSSEVKEFETQIESYANQSLRTIGIAYRDFEGSWPPKKATIPQLKINDGNPDDEIESEGSAIDPFDSFTFVGIVGIMDPLRPGVKKAVQDCKEAGVVVRMVTGDNVNTARAIATECGIYDPSLNHIVMEGPEFRKLKKSEMIKVLPELRVLARSSPEDKRILVENLKKMGETVAVTGDGTNDAPALKLADVGFSMGIAGTEVAKEASEIILMDDNFGSIVKAIMWGRTVNDAVKKFLQFQLTVNVTAVLLTFISAVASSENRSVLTAVQLLWVNLIMDTFAALALATDPPAPSILNRKPDNRNVSLITPTMWKMILGQAVFQLVVTFVLNFAGPSIFNVDTAREETELHAMVFNTFVWMQFFNMFVSRRLDNKMNMFEGIHRNWYFILITGIILGCQILIMFVGGAAFSVERQTGGQWAVAIVCGFFSIPVGILLRLIPDRWVVRLYPERFVRYCTRKLSFKRKSRRPEIMVDDEEVQFGEFPQFRWNPAIEQVRQDLLILKLRGGRWSQIKSKPKEVIMTWKEAMSPSKGSSINETSSPTSTLAPSTPILTTPSYAHSPSSPNSNSLGEDGLLAVPNPNASLPTYRSRNNSTGSRGSSIGALTMIPAIVGGAIAGWSPEIDEQTHDQRNN